MKKSFEYQKKDIIITLLFSLFLYHFSGLNNFFPNFSSHLGVFSYYTSFLKISSRFSEYQNKYNQKSLFAVFDFATWAAGIYEHVLKYNLTSYDMALCCAKYAQNMRKICAAPLRRSARNV